MTPVVDLVLALVLMPVAGYALIGVWRGANWLAEARCKPPPPVPTARLAADLRRLRAELFDTETRAELVAKQHRVRALRAAYLDTLTTACERLGVGPPGPGASVAEIYRTEAALRERGLDVRDTAAR